MGGRYEEVKKFVNLKLSLKVGCHCNKAFDRRRGLRAEPKRSSTATSV
jgi:hypothetical protein